MAGDRRPTDPPLAATGCAVSIANRKHAIASAFEQFHHQRLSLLAAEDMEPVASSFGHNVPCLVRHCRSDSFIPSSMRLQRLVLYVLEDR